jgi:hypothetical protein
VSGIRRALAAACGLMLAQAPTAILGKPIIRVSVVDNSGAPVSGLRPDEFSVWSGGRQIPHELAGGSEAETFIVLVDTSSSMPLSERHRRRLIVDGLGQRLTEQDEVFIAPMSAMPGPDAVRKASLHGALEALAKAQESRTEPSAMWDALVSTGQWIRSRQSQPPTVLLITDGRATGNRCGVNDAVQAMLAAQTPVSVLSAAAPTEVMRERTSTIVVDPNRILRQVAQATGGDYIEGAFSRMAKLFGNTSKLDAEIDRDRDLLRTWVTRARAQYVLRIDLAPDAASGPVEVRVRRPGTTVRASRVASTGEVPSCLRPRPNERGSVDAFGPVEIREFAIERAERQVPGLPGHLEHQAV